MNGTSTYFAAAQMNNLIAIAEEGLRDLSSQDLKKFWTGVPSESQEAVAARFAASEAFRSENSLTPISASTFSVQASKGGAQNTFMNYLADMGLERTYVEDVYYEDEEFVLPTLAGLSDVISLLEAKGYEADVENLATMFPGVSLDFEIQTIQHLREPLPSAWADEDSLVERRLARARTYLYLYLGSDI